MLLIARGIMIVGMIIRALAFAPVHPIIAPVFGGFAGGPIFFPIFLTMISDVAEESDRPEAISTFMLFSSIGMLSGPSSTSLLLTNPQITLRTIYQIIVVCQIGFCILTSQVRRDFSNDSTHWLPILFCKSHNKCLCSHTL